MPLSLYNITKNFDKRTVLREVTFSVEKGEIFGIAGPASAGKTVLIDVIAGKLFPDAGAISLNGNEITRLSHEKRRFQMPADGKSSIWQSLRRSANASASSICENRFAAFQAAIDGSSEVLLLDNSFCGMDRITREAAFDNLRGYAAEQSAAVVFATNDYEEVFLACDRVAVIIDARIRQIGIPREVYESPADSLVARFVGRENFFTARRITSSRAEIPEYQTLTGNHRFSTSKIASSQLAALNQNVTLGIRPEHVSISFGASFPEDNVIRAKVTRIRFLGTTTLVRFDSQGLTIEAIALRVVGLNEGDECMLSLPPDRIQVFRD